MTTNVAFRISHYSQVTSEADPIDDWGADSYSESNSLEGFWIVTDSGMSWDTIVPFTPVKGQRYWAVTITWSTGDSFHNVTGKLDVVTVYEHRHDAEQAKISIEKTMSQGYQYGSGTRKAKAKEAALPPNTARIPNGLGGLENFYCGTYLGYFESVDSVSVESTKLIDPSGSRR